MAQLFRSGALLGAAGLLLASCSVVGPDYEPVEPELPDVYHAPLPDLFRGAVVAARWWTLFGDPVLTTLVERGRVDNLDIRIALSRVREARALARGVESERLPQIDAGAQATADYESAAGEDDAGFTAIVGAFLEGAWEVDLFGRLQRRREAAWALAEREEALGREARRLATAEIARSYVTLRSVERRIALAERSLALQRQTLALVVDRVSAGLAPGLDRVRAEAAVASLEAELGPLRSEAARLRNALAILVGEPPGALSALLAEPAPIPMAVAGATVGVPADLVRRRPDIQAVELQIAAATAELGVEIAELYPRLTLPGTLDVARVGLGSAEAVNTVVATLAGVLRMPVYDGGLRRALVDAAEERVQQAMLQYRSVVLQALEQVEAALFAYRGARARHEALERAEEGNRAAFRQSQALYRQGLVTFLDVLDSQREWNTSQQDLATAARDLSLAVVNILSALGGGGAALPL